MPSPTVKISSPRKEWDQPHLSVLKALDEANILTSKTVMFEKTNQNKTKISDFTKDGTYLIGDQKSNSQLVNEKPPDFINNLTGESFKTTWEEVLEKISPLKSDMLQMTKNIWQEMTRGKFDTKNTKVNSFLCVYDINF